MRNILFPLPVGGSSGSQTSCWYWNICSSFQWERNIFNQVSVLFSSVAHSCPTLCNPMNHSTPGFPVHHQLPEFTQTHIHWVGDAIQPCPSEVKQTNKQTQHKSHPIWSLHKPLNQPQEGRHKKERKNSTLKPGKGNLKQNKLKKKKVKRQRNTAQMKEQTRNTEVQVNEEEIGKLPEKEFRIMIVKMIKTLTAEWRKC